MDPRKRRFPSSFSEGFPCLLFFWWVVVDIFYIKLLCGGFKHFLFSPLPGEIIQFDYKYNIIQTGWFSRQLEKDIYREKPPEVALDFDMAGSSDGILVQTCQNENLWGPWGAHGDGNALGLGNWEGLQLGCPNNQQVNQYFN